MSNIINIQLAGGNTAQINGGSTGGGVPNGGTYQNNTQGWSSEPFFSTLPEQIAGFNPMYPCNYSDCRGLNSCFLSPVFGTSGQVGPGTENDVSTFTASWSGYTPQFLIQKVVKGAWVTQATVSDNTYGVYLSLGNVPDNPTWVQFSVNWGLVIRAFGTGTYQIALNGCVTTGTTQATLTITISSWNNNSAVVGTFTIGSVVYPLNYEGTYTGYLNYLAYVITSTITTPQYSAVTTATGITITGTQGSLDNGTLVKQSVTDMTYSFYAQNNTGLIGGEIETATGASPLTLGITPQGFSTIIYDNGSCYSPSTFTAGATMAQQFTGFESFFLQGANASQYITNLTVNLEIYVNGVILETIQLFTGIINLGSYFNYQYNAQIPWSSLVLNLNTGDTVLIKVSASCTWIGGGNISLVVGACNPNSNGYGTGSYWLNQPQNVINTNWGTLTGGGSPVLTCQCAVTSQPFLVRNWNCAEARGTVKFEINLSGTIGDAFNDGNLFVFNGYSMYDSIRVPGYFGNEEPVIEEVVNEWGFSLNEPIGQIEKTRGKEIPNNKFWSKAVPWWMYKTVLRYAFLPAGLGFQATDYNANNANWFLIQKLQKLKGGVKTKYYNKGHFDRNLNWRNRLLCFECTFEDAIQSGIATESNL